MFVFPSPQLRSDWTTAIWATMAAPSKARSAVRDIRTDLKERLMAAEAKRAQLTVALTALDTEIRAVMNLMEIEDHRLAVMNGRANGKELPPLEEFILARINLRPSSKDDLRIAAQAEGYDVNGRNIHGHLLNLARSGIIRRMEDHNFVVLPRAE
jgi:hypothetical protein